MGCTSSSPATETQKHNSKDSSLTKAANGGTATTKKESAAAAPANAIRKASSFNLDKGDLVETPNTLSVIGGDGDGVDALKVRYACVSRRGRDPDDATKLNQDCYSVHAPRRAGATTADATAPPSLFQATGGALFSVYDGHGPQGRDCSHFVRQRLPALIDRNLTFHRDQIKNALHEAHTECNLELRASAVQDAYSGTTAISIYIHGRARGGAATDQHKITVCNVGDSRAILGTTTAEQDGGGGGDSRHSLRLQAVPLSKDQTPKRADEAARCLRSGARILSFGQIDPTKKDADADDDIEDPPRVWAKQGLYPGTAFTRSLGDAVAERLGVCAEPECTTLLLPASVKVLVLASDGVFDVMSDQDVVDACGRWHQDPLRACQEIVAASHDEWMRNEDCGEDLGAASYDDITVICIFIDDGHATTVEEATQAECTRDETEKTTPADKDAPSHQHKRVRQKTLRNLEELAVSGH